MQKSLQGYAIIAVEMRLSVRSIMPTVLRIGSFKFYFYSHEPSEPPHIHIDRDRYSAKF